MNSAVYIPGHLFNFLVSCGLFENVSKDERNKLARPFPALVWSTFSELWSKINVEQAKLAAHFVHRLASVFKEFSERLFGLFDVVIHAENIRPISLNLLHKLRGGRKD